MIAGRGHYGHKPYAGKAQITNIIELFGCSLKITDTIPIGVCKGIDKDFIPVANIIVGNILGKFLS